MSLKTLVWNADGTPAVIDMGPQERMSTLLLELFGTLIKYQGSAPAPLTVEQALPIIADIVTPEAIEARFTGIKLQVTRRKHASGKES